LVNFLGEGFLDHSIKRKGTINMDFFDIFIVLAIVCGVIGTIAWYVFFVWVVKKAITTAQQNLNQMLPNIEQLIQSYSQLPPHVRGQQQMNIMNMINQANTQLGQLNDIQRQRYDLRVSELQGMAANAGIDWTP
jgi:predicted PurR-regulated permease PerM